MFWAMYFHRKSRGFQAEHWHESLKAEVAWTVVPFIILIAMAFPATTALKDLYDTSEADIDIKVTGYQWRWQYEYLGEGVTFLSELATNDDQIYNREDKGEFYLQEVNNPLVVPVHKKIRMLVTAQDVIHSWWMPDFGVKRDAIPGYINETWFNVDEPGIYRGECTELCGQGHAFMPIVVRAVEQDEYDSWLADKKADAQAQNELMAQNFTMDELMARGEQAYARTCAACHQLNGSGLPPAFPALAGSLVATGPVDQHLNIVINGVQGTAMQAFGALLNEVDIAAIITYERNAWGNETGDIVQPIDVYNYAQGQ
jgi:cytochrome c oxidase subunit II